MDCSQCVEALLDAGQSAMNSAKGHEGAHYIHLISGNKDSSVGLICNGLPWAQLCTYFWSMAPPALLLAKSVIQF